MANPFVFQSSGIKKLTIDALAFAMHLQKPISPGARCRTERQLMANEAGKVPMELT